MAQFLDNERFGDGSDGAYAPSTGTDAPIDSACTGTISTNSLSATNASFSAGQIILIHQTRGTGAGQWELNRIASYTAGTITTKYPLTYGYVSGAQVLVIKQYRSALIDTGVTLTAKAWDGTVGGIVSWICNGLSSVVGTINLSYKRYRGGQAPGGAPGNSGEGTSGASVAQYTANGSGGGGGGNGGGPEGGAGGGGHANSGGDGTGTNHGSGGGTSGSVNLVTATFGGAGGSTAQAQGYNGGSGGGFCLIISPTITISGSITSNGEAGGGASGTHSPGGGGSGGSILFKGKSITLGTSITASAGAAGTAGAGGSAGGGSVGRIHADYFTSISGTTSPSLDSTQDRTLGDSFMGAMI